MLSFDPAFALFQDYFAGLEHLGFSAALDKEKAQQERRGLVGADVPSEASRAALEKRIRSLELREVSTAFLSDQRAGCSECRFECTRRKQS